MRALLPLLLCLFLVGCTDKRPTATEHIDQMPDISPDYISVTIPEQIAPLNFEVTTHRKLSVLFEADDYQFVVNANKGSLQIPPSKWCKLLAHAKGKNIRVTVHAKENNTWKSFIPFSIYVSDDAIDPYVAYRLIAPGYQLWSEMGIYQRELASYKQTAVLENKQTGNNCMNCHSFCDRDPDKMMLHIRAAHGCTVLWNDGKIETLNTKADKAMSALVYPYWHPSGKYIAFSVNNTTSQDTHPIHRTEVYDKASDIVVFDVEKKEIVTTKYLFSAKQFETFPAFSPDGKYLYFCTAEAAKMPDQLNDLRYNICRIPFDAANRSFGTEVDTLFHAAQEEASALLPRISPDGRYLLFTTTDYGTFPIWHANADLRMIDLTDDTTLSMDEVNSPQADSYHAWSSNSKWILFSSRRIDGLYTRLFIAHVDADGQLSKPFLLPQQSPQHDALLMQSYNIPEFVKGKVTVNSYKLASTVKEGDNKPVSFMNR
ncbi:hypothetical protein LJC44_06620 [Parabacteroides sp. OttesenSCG-928-G06]|nr:hypothetical protein [Parabacteroides sp. OttesenSCG-928-K15]MDL2282754.1 hypothetical protein [Parabacteroides sp. OttesenSCG-928-G06]